MTTVVSFETAKALRDAGFSIPEPNHGQFWYIEYTGELEVITFVGDNGVHRMYIPFLKGMNSCAKEPFLNGSVFAPTATDIMSELTPICFLMKDSPVNGRILWQGQVEAKRGILEYRTEKYDNPHDAAAELWAYVNNK